MNLHAQDNCNVFHEAPSPSRKRRRKEFAVEEDVGPIGCPTVDCSDGVEDLPDDEHKKNTAVHNIVHSENSVHPDRTSGDNEAVEEDTPNNLSLATVNVSKKKRPTSHSVSLSAVAQRGPFEELDVGEGEGGKSRIQFALECNWHSSYVRTRHKNLRCFPFCSQLHRERSFCGIPISVFVTCSSIATARKIHLVGRFRRVRDPALCMPKDHMDFLTGSPNYLILGTFVEYNGADNRALFEFAPPRKWRYNCEQNKYTRAEMHAFTVYLFDESGICIDVKDSPRFRFVSAWRQSVESVSRPFNPFVQRHPQGPIALGQETMAFGQMPGLMMPGLVMPGVVMPGMVQGTGEHNRQMGYPVPILTGVSPAQVLPTHLQGTNSKSEAASSLRENLAEGQQTANMNQRETEQLAAMQPMHMHHPMALSPFYAVPGFFPGIPQHYDAMAAVKASSGNAMPSQAYPTSLDAESGESVETPTKQTKSL